MKKRQNLSSAYLSVFCLELSYILRSGMPFSRGLMMLRDSDNSVKSRALLTEICEYVDIGEPLSKALTETGCFPDYMIRMVALSERTGRMEFTLAALAKHYEHQRTLYQSIQQAVVYPALLIVVFLAVASVVITQVLPVFEDIFSQTGTRISSSAIRILGFGQVLSGSLKVLAVIAGAFVFISLLSAFIPQLRHEIRNALYYRFGTSGLWGDFAQARFASGLSVAVASGLSVSECLESAGALVSGAQKMDERLADCKAILDREGNLSVALSDSGIFSPMNSRILSLGFETGNIDEAMSAIAEKIETSAHTKLANIVSSIEPTIVIIMTIAAGIVLLAVVFPLMNIMSNMF